MEKMLYFWHWLEKVEMIIGILDDILHDLQHFLGHIYDI